MGQQGAERGDEAGAGPSRVSGWQQRQLQGGEYKRKTSFTDRGDANGGEGNAEEEGEEGGRERVAGATSLLFSEQQQERLRRLSR